MKKLITNITGGFPFVLDDLRWMDQGINEALFALCRSMLRPDADAVILSGCEVSQPYQDQVDITAGWVYLHNQQVICRVNAQTLQNQGTINIRFTGETARWKFYELTDSAGNKTFYNNSPEQTYKVQYARLILDDDDTYPSLASSIRQTSWIQPTLLSGWTSQQTGELQYCLRNGHILFRGNINGQAGDVFILPEWARPARYLSQHLQTKLIQGVWCAKEVNIATNGMVSISSQDDGEGVTPSTTIPMNFMVPLW